ncbi:MAG: hypothetical protein FWD05_11735 [Oscillospiraceae bacterium]|nr:hypothetical protein [Oscillospiraceae bacterium]
MVNEVRKSEILAEIRKIETGLEEAEIYLTKLQKTEGDCSEDLRKLMAGVQSEYEACRGDQRLTNATEDYYALLVKTESECCESLDDVRKTRKELRAKCEADIEALRQELHGLELI